MKLREKAKKKDDRRPPLMFSQRKNPYCELLQYVAAKYSF